MPPVLVQLAPPRRTELASTSEEFDPATFTAEVIADVDVLSESHKCNCAASDDNPY